MSKPPQTRVQSTSPPSRENTEDPSAAQPISPSEAAVNKEEPFVSCVQQTATDNVIAVDQSTKEGPYAHASSLGGGSSPTVDGGTAMLGSFGNCLGAEATASASLPMMNDLVYGVVNDPSAQDYSFGLSPSSTEEFTTWLFQDPNIEATHGTGTEMSGGAAFFNPHPTSFGQL